MQFDPIFSPLLIFSRCGTHPSPNLDWAVPGAKQKSIESCCHEPCGIILRSFCKFCGVSHSGAHCPQSGGSSGVSESQLSTWNKTALTPPFFWWGKFSCSRVPGQPRKLLDSSQDPTACRVLNSVRIVPDWGKLGWKEIRFRPGLALASLKPPGPAGSRGTLSPAAAAARAGSVSSGWPGRHSLKRGGWSSWSQSQQSLWVGPGSILVFGET